MAEINTHTPNTYLVRQRSADQLGIPTSEDQTLTSFVGAGLKSVAGLAQKGFHGLESSSDAASQKAEVRQVVEAHILEARAVIDAMAARLNICPRSFEDDAIINGEQGEFVVVEAPGSN